MELPKLNEKLSNIFSAKNKKRTYKIHFKGDKGSIIFVEHAKKEWVLQAFLKTAKIVGGKLGTQDLPKGWVVDDRQKLMWLNPQIEPYIKNVEENVARNKFSNFTIFKYELKKMEFEETEKDVFEVRLFVDIWVSV